LRTKLKLRNKSRLIELATEDKRVLVEDLKKLVDSQLSQQSQIFGFLSGVVFGGILSVAVSSGIKLTMIFDILTQPVFAIIFIALGGWGLALVLGYSLEITSSIGFRFKIDLMKDYFEAREIVEKRSISGNAPGNESGNVKLDSQQKGVPPDPPLSLTTDDILDRVRYVDQKYSLWKNPQLWIWGMVGAFLLTLVVVLSLQVSILKGTELYIFLAVDLAAFSFLFQYFEFFLRRMKWWTVEANYTRLQKHKRDLLTQALIIMKFEAPDFPLLEAYQLNPGLFTTEALVERVYRR